MQSWWQLFIQGCLILLLIAGGVVAWTGEVPPRQLAHRAIYRSAVMYTSWQTRNWLETESAHFCLRYRPEDSEVARLVLDNAEAAYLPAAELLQYRPKGKSLLVLHPDRASLAREFGWTASESAMGVYWNGVIRLLSPQDWVYSQDLEEIKRVFSSIGPMVHEYTHLLVDCKARGNYPRWLTEGIAQYVERQLIGFTMPAPAEITAWYPLARMDRGFDSLPDQSLAYYQSLVLVDYLEQRWGWEAVLQLLERLGQGDSLEQACRQILSVSLKEFEAMFNKAADLERQGRQKAAACF